MPTLNVLLRAMIVASLASLSASDTMAQEWARKMFNTVEHNFGAVARGAKAEYRFQITNLYEEDAHILSVESSCGCTTPEITKRTLKTFEKGEIIAVYNTRAFLGSKSAVLTVKFDLPFPAEVQLHIDGYIRSDVVLTPGSVEFNAIGQGAKAEKALDIEYAGRNDWRVVDVRTTNPHLEAELVETKRGGGKVGYRLLVRLLDDTPPGYINEQLTIVTNDEKLPTFPLEVTGKVTSTVTVSPSPLFLGTLKPGQKVIKRIVVRGKKPFRILAVKCDDDCFSFDTSNSQSKPLHLVPVTFVSDRAGKVTGHIHIETDLGEGVVPDLPAYAEVVE